MKTTGKSNALLLQHRREGAPLGCVCPRAPPSLTGAPATGQPCRQPPGRRTADAVHRWVEETLAQAGYEPERMLLRLCDDEHICASSARRANHARFVQRKIISSEAEYGFGFPESGFSIVQLCKKGSRLDADGCALCHVRVPLRCAPRRRNVSARPAKL